MLQWQQNAGAGFVNLADGGQFTGVNKDTLTITNVTLAQDNYKYRCIATLGLCGDTSQSALLVVNINTFIGTVPDKNFYSFYPNPANEWLKVNLNVTYGTQFSINLIDIAGGVVLHRSIRANPGGNSIELDVSMLAKGVYILNVTTTADAFYSKVIID
jgi:hypothetical protein